MMRNIKKHVKIELGILFFFFLSILVFELFARNYIDNYQEKVIAYEGTLETKTMELKDFSKVYATTSIKIEMKEGDPKIEIHSSPEVIEMLEVEEKSRSSTLSITMPDEDFIEGDLLLASKITIYFRDLEEISNEYNCRIYVQDEIEADKLFLESSGNARIEVKAKVNDLKTSSSGNSTIDVMGSATEVNASSSGNSHLRMEDCISNKVKLDASGNSSVNINVTQRIVGNASGNSRINIEGDPEERRTNSSGNASVNFKN